MPLPSASSRLFRATLLAAAVAAGLAAPVAALAQAAVAADRVVDFRIPAQRLDLALTAFADQADVQIVFASAQVAGRRGNALEGRHPVARALERLLAGTGVNATFGEAGTIRIVPAAANAGVATGALQVQGGQVLAGALGAGKDRAIGTELLDPERPMATVLRQADIDRLQTDNIAQLLDTLPGVGMAGSPRPGGQSLNIWGMGDMEDIKVVLDGAPKGFEKYRQGSVFIEPELVKRIDVDKGPHNLLYGNGGFGGTIRIETKDPADLLRPGRDLGAFAKYSHHSNDDQNVYSGAVFGRSGGGNADAMLYLTRRNGGNATRPDRSRFVFSANDLDAALVKGNLYFGQAHTLTLSAMKSGSTGWEPFAAKRDDMAAPTQSEIDRYGLDEAWRRKLVYRDQDDENYSAKYKYAPQDNPWLELTASFAWSRTRQHDLRPDSASTSSFLGSLGNESWASYTDRLADISNVSRFDLLGARHELTAGLQWHDHDRDTLMYYPAGSAIDNPDYNYGYFQPYYMPAGKQRTASGYLQDAMTWGTLTVTAALRYDAVRSVGKPNLAPRYNDPAPEAGHDYGAVTYRGWSPRLGLAWEASHSLSLFADLSRTWRSPVIDELYEVQSAASNVPGTSRDLDKERIRALRLGAVASFDDLFAAADNLLLRLTAFENRGKDEIFYRRGILCAEQVETGSSSDCAQPLSNYRNLPGYTIRGVEFEGFYDSRRLFGSLSLSTIRGQRDASPRDPWGPRTWIAEIPPRKAVATFGVKMPEWDMAFGYTATAVRRQDRSPADADPEAGVWALPKTRGYTLHGLFASWQPSRFDGFQARLSVDNLTNHDYYPYLGESVSGLGRNIKLSLSQSF